MQTRLGSSWKNVQPYVYFKIWKTSHWHVIVFFCSNAVGHLIQPGLLYRAANPHALKSKNKNLLCSGNQIKKGLGDGSIIPGLLPPVLNSRGQRVPRREMLLIRGKAPCHHKALQFPYVKLSFSPPSPLPSSNLLVKAWFTASSPWTLVLWMWFPILMCRSVGSPSTLLIASLILNRQWM
jgi:hypothetical protein